MAKKIVIYGNGQFAGLLYQLMSADHAFDVAAFTADRQYLKGTMLHGLPLVEFDTVETRYPPADFDMLLAIGVTRMRDRERMFEKAKAKGYYLPNYIGKRAITYPNLVMGENNIVFDGTCLELNGQLGDNNMIMANCYVGHDFRIGSHNYLAAGCAIGGTSRIGSLCYIGIGTTTIQKITIADEVLVGAGSLLVRDAKPCCRYFGVPARKTGEHSETGIVFTHGGGGL